MKAGCRQRATKGWIPRGAFSHTDSHGLGLSPNKSATNFKIAKMNDGQYLLEILEMKFGCKLKPVMHKYKYITRTKICITVFENYFKRLIFFSCQIGFQSHFHFRQYAIFESVSGFWICFLYIHKLVVPLLHNRFCIFCDNFHTLHHHGFLSQWLVNNLRCN